MVWALALTCYFGQVTSLTLIFSSGGQSYDSSSRDRAQGQKENNINNYTRNMDMNWDVGDPLLIC